MPFSSKILRTTAVDEKEKSKAKSIDIWILK
jgi:hypothetical protein